MQIIESASTVITASVCLLAAYGSVDLLKRACTALRQRRMGRKRRYDGRYSVGRILS